MDGDDEWPQGQLVFNPQGRLLTTDSLLDAPTGAVPYLYGELMCTL